MTFKDLLKDMLMNGVNTTEMGMIGNMSALLCSLLVGLYLFVIYKMFVRKTLYNLNFNITLVGMTLITTAIMLTIQSNLVLSLGMVGALSIVRYRTAIKEPMDLFFLFWAIAGGLMCGSGQYTLAATVTVILTLVVFLLAQAPSGQAPYVLVLNGESAGLEASVCELLKVNCKYYKIKSRSISDGRIRMIVELKTSSEKELLEAVAGLKNVEKCSLLTYEGDVVG